MLVSASLFTNDSSLAFEKRGYTQRSFNVASGLATAVEDLAKLENRLINRRTVLDNAFEHPEPR